MSIPLSNDPDIFDIPDGLADWCALQGIEADLYARFDGGGHNGYVVAFPNPASIGRVLEAFPSLGRRALLGEMLQHLGPLRKGRI